MRPYLAILSSRFRTLLQYRAAAIAGVGTQLFFGVVRVMIYDAFYRSASGPQPLAREQVITYVWLGQATLMLTMLGVEAEVAAMIRSGNVAGELVKPLDLYSLWFSRALSGRAAPLIMRGIPIFAVAGTFLGLQAPASFAAGALFLVSLLAGLLLAAALATLLTVSLMWTISGEGVSRLAPALIFFFSGIGVPLPLFPDQWQQVIAVLPFRALIDTPFRIYMGNLAGVAAAGAMAHQLAWLAALVLAGRFTLRRGVGRLVVQGG